MWILYTILGFIALLLIIAFINSLLIKDRRGNVQPIEIDNDKTQEYAEEFAKMIRIETISYDPKKKNDAKFFELHKVMQELFPNVYNTVEQKVFEGGSILFKWKGKSDEKPMVLMAHQDVVPADKDGWDYEPFSGEITDEYIYGRGTLDTKSTLYGIFKAIDELIISGFTPDYDIYISSASDEENSGPGASYSVEYLKNNGVTPYIVLDEGGAILTGGLPSAKKPIAYIGVIEKGYVNIKFTAHSKGGHSSTPPKNTPLARLGAFVNDVEKKFPLKTKMIKEVEDIFKNSAPIMAGIYRFLFGNMWLFKPLLVKLLPMISPFGRALLSTSIAFTMATGSEAENVIPSKAYVIANLRTHPIQNIQESFEVLQKIAAKYDIEAEIMDGREASRISSTSNDAYKYLIESITKSYPDVLTSPYVMLGGTDCRFFSEITESAFRFSPVRMNNDELSKIHGKNEAIKKSAIYEAVNFYKDFIKYHK
jgi:carboxypeptidase PM20D1